MDDLDRLRLLVDVYEAALAELRGAQDQALDELITRLECRLAAAEYALDELLHPLGSREPLDVLPRRVR